MAHCRKKRIFSFWGYCYFNLRGGLGVRGGEGCIWNIKSSIEISPSVSTLETASQRKRHLSSEVGARIPSTFSHSFFLRTWYRTWRTSSLPFFANFVSLVFPREGGRKGSVARRGDEGWSCGRAPILRQILRVLEWDCYQIWCSMWIE